MNNLFLALALLSIPVMFYFGTRMLISHFKKNKPHTKKMLKLLGVSIGVMVVSFIAFAVTIDPAETEQAKINIAEREEAKKVALLAEEKKAEEAAKEEKAAAELKAKQDAEAKVKVDAEKKDKDVAQKKEPAKSVPTGSKTKVESAVNESIHKHFGKTSNIDKRKNIVDVSFDEEIGLLTAIVLGNDNLSTKFIVGGMHKAVAGVAQDMKDVAEVKELMIFVQFPLVDAYGNEKDGDVMRVNLTRSTLDKINFENFDYNKVPDIADSYFLHKALQSK